MRAAVDEIDRLIGQQVDRGRSRAVDVIVLTGPPNAGKSTLLNTLAQRDAAIVSDVAGTTRDVIEVDVPIGDRLVRLVDTAGIDDNDDPLVAAAESLRREQAEQASLVLYCRPATSDQERTDDELSTLQETRRVVHVATKTDLTHAGECDVGVSAFTGEGLSELVAYIAAELDSMANERSELLAVTAARCRGALLGARERLLVAIELLQLAAGDELVAGELRTALDDLATVLGRVYTDDILDRVFSRFCIGK